MKTIISLYTLNEEPHKVMLEIPPGKISLDELVSPLHMLYNSIIMLEMNGKKITCKKGCCACCIQMIPLSIPEVFYLDKLINTLPSAHKKRVKKRFARNKNLLYGSNLLTSLKNPRKVRSLDEEYFQLGLDCPFLESGICSIYQNRPFVCREYYVQSPAGLCRSPYTASIQKVKINLNIGALLSSFTAKLLGLASTPVPLIIIPDWAERFRYPGEQKFPADWMFKKILHALSTVEPEQGNIKKIQVRF
ncbi:MAG: YkgJ family cysteine cluster protein [Spirochaetales bacterium]|nr:YkgJ family cysteine cluster protein [Spirochaetales bacterium]